MRAGLKRIWVGGAIGAACAFYALIFAEAFIRVVAPQSFVPREVTAAPFGVRMNTPNAVYDQRTPETHVTVRINAAGLRAPREFPVSAPADRARIAVLGDSYFLGYEADYEHAPPTQIETLLREANCRVEVLNFSVSGFGTAEMLRTLEEKALAFRPSVVIFEWHHTDSDDNRRAALYRLDNGALQRTDNRYVPAVAAREGLAHAPLYRLLSRESHLFAFARERASRFIRRAMAGHVFARKGGAPAETRSAEATALDVALLQAAEARARDAGAEFYVVEVPGVAARTRFRSSLDLLPRALRARSNYVETMRAFEAAAGADRMLFWERGQKHLTPLGARVLAEAAATRMLDDPATRAAIRCVNSPQLAARQ